MAIDEASFERLSQHIGMFRHSTNIGVILSGGKIFLIDSGPSKEDGKRAEEALSSLFPGAKIAAVIHTHSHADHCSGSLYLKSIPGVQFWASAQSARIMEIPSAVPSLYCGGTAVAEFDDPQFTLPEPVRTDRITGDEEADLEDVTLQFISLPGHFFGQTGILARDKKSGTRALFAGDSLFGAELLSRTWIPFMISQTEFRNSVRKIESVQADAYIPGHGSRLDSESIHACAEMNILVTYEFESLILKIIGTGLRRTEDILKDIADYAGIRLKVIPFYLIGTTLRSYLSCMEHEGKVSCEIKENKLIWKRRI